MGERYSMNVSKHSGDTDIFIDYNYSVRSQGRIGEICIDGFCDM